MINYAYPLHCAKCGKELHKSETLARRARRNDLIIVFDGYELYWVFDSAKCCREFFEKYGYENSGFYSNSEVEKLVNYYYKLPRWHVSRLTIKIVEQLITKGKMKDD